MGQQIIRNASTLDRGPVVRATTDEVLKAVKDYQGDFSTYDIARVLGIEEYPVRAAVSWLARYGLIEIIPGVRSKRYRSMPTDRRPHDDDYSVSMYRVKERAAPADFAALNRAFGFA